jgi:hypothetical protein
LPNLESFGRALRLRCPWLQWTDPGRPWVGSKLPCDDKDMSLFYASTKITLGDGNKALFGKITGRGRADFVILPQISTRLRPERNVWSPRSWITIGGSPPSRA